MKEETGRIIFWCEKYKETFYSITIHNRKEDVRASQFIHVIQKQSYVGTFN